MVRFRMQREIRKDAGRDKGHCNRKKGDSILMGFTVIPPWVK